MLSQERQKILISVVTAGLTRIVVMSERPEKVLTRRCEELHQASSLRFACQKPSKSNDS